jgi:hypothetical protein
MAGRYARQMPVPGPADTRWSQWTTRSSDMYPRDPQSGSFAPESSPDVAAQRPNISALRRGGSARRSSRMTCRSDQVGARASSTCIAPGRRGCLASPGGGASVDAGQGCGPVPLVEMGSGGGQSCATPIGWSGLRPAPRAELGVAGPIWAVTLSRVASGTRLAAPRPSPGCRTDPPRHGDGGRSECDLPAGATFGELCEAWLAHAQNHVAPIRQSRRAPRRGRCRARHDGAHDLAHRRGG